jgi:hypothetical protein
VHEGEPDVRCELPGAFAELKLLAVGVYVPGATSAKATEADKAISNIANAVTIPTRLMFLLFLYPSLLRLISKKGRRWTSPRNFAPLASPRIGRICRPPEKVSLARATVT